MKCAICGMTIGSTKEAIDQGWIPYVKDGGHEKDGPFCASCAETLIQIDDDGEFVVKEEYKGKIQYQEGNFSEEEKKEHDTIDIVLEHSEN